jgi:large subunit ribosomal protein L13
MKAVQPKTYSATASEAKAGQRWYLIDAEGQVLGRVATTVARLIRGKGKPTYTPHMDGGDYVIVVNAEKIVVTGGKETQKFYYRHSQYPGGITAVAFKDMRVRHPHRILEEAVRGMLPKNALGKRMFHHLKVYAGPEHPHAAQQPVQLDLVRDGTRRGEVVGGLPAALAAAPPAPAKERGLGRVAARPAREAAAPAPAILEEEAAPEPAEALPATEMAEPAAELAPVEPAEAAEEREGTEPAERPETTA